MDIGVIAVCVWLITVVLIDIFRQRIPNTLLLLMVIPATLIVLVRGQGILGADPISGFSGLLIAGLMLLPGYFLGGVGAGDVKLAAVLGLLSGFSAALFWLLYSALALGVLSTIVVLIRYRFKTSWKKIPAAIALATGFLSYLCWGKLLLGGA